MMGGSRAPIESILVVQQSRIRLPMQERWDPLEKEMTTHSSILAWEISGTEEPGGL